MLRKQQTEQEHFTYQTEKIGWQYLHWESSHIFVYLPTEIVNMFSKGQYYIVDIITTISGNTVTKDYCKL